MIFKLNRIDITSKIEVAGYTVIPRKVFGSSEGYLLTGDHIADLIRTKTDIVVKIVATEQADTSFIASACKAEYCELEFSDPITNTVLSGIYEPSLDQLSMAIEEDSQGNTYWYGFTITFKEK